MTRASMIKVAIDVDSAHPETKIFHVDVGATDDVQPSIDRRRLEYEILSHRVHDAILVRHFRVEVPVYLMQVRKPGFEAFWK